MEANNNTQTQPLQPPVYQAPIVAQPAYVPQMPAQVPPSSSKKGIFIIIFLVLLILGVVGGIFAFINMRSSGGTGGGGEIVWWGLWEDASIVTPLITKYESENPGVTIKYVKQSPEEYRERLASAMARGDAPDIFRIHNTWVPMFNEELAVIPSSVMSEEEYRETFYTPIVESLVSKEGPVGIPLMYDSLGLFVNQDLFTTFSASVPSGWDELRQTATELTIRDVTQGLQQSGFAMGQVENIDNWQEIITLMLIQNGADLVKLDGVLAIDPYRYFLQFKSTDRIWDETFPPSKLAFSTGKVAMIIAPSSAAWEINRQNPSLKFRVYPVPQLTKLSESDPDITYATFWTEAVWSQSKKQTQAWEFLKFLSSSESLQTLYNNSKESEDVLPGAYPRKDMKGFLTNDPFYGATVNLADDAKVWYTASDTNDGETGINTLLAAAYIKGLQFKNVGNVANDLESILPQISIEVRTVLSKYGLVAPPPPPEE